MSRAAPSAQEPRRRRTLQALKAAGADLLADQPIDALAISDIVARAGVAKGSFFNHFSGKDAFASAIAADVRGKIEAEIAAANADVEDPVLRLARVLARLCAFAVEDPPAVRLMLRASPLGPEPGHPLNAGLRADLKAGRAAGRLSAGSEDAAVVFVIGVAQALAAAILRRDDPRSCPRAMTIPLVELVLTGLGVPPAETGALARQAAELVPPAVSGDGPRLDRAQGSGGRA